MENQEKTLWERLRHTYRLVIMNNESFEEMGSYRLSLLNVYILLSTIVVMVAIMMWMLITYTPLKQYIPGYNKGGVEYEKVIALTRQLDQLEREAAAHRGYAENFRKILTANVQTEDDIKEPTDKINWQDSTLNTEASEIEEELRAEVEMQEVGLYARNGEQRANFANSKPLAQFHFIPPVNGEVSRSFSAKEKHLGIDLIAPQNTPIKAVLDGYVFFTEFSVETGNVIAIQHANNTVSVYKHNSILLKEMGSFVKAGEAVAVIGNTGMKTDGPHLHFELWHNGRAVDPAEYLNFSA